MADGAETKDVPSGESGLMILSRQRGRTVGPSSYYAGRIIHQQ